jgi:serine/threonine protein kinase
MVYLRSKHIVHRDLKPDNILIGSTEPFTLKLCDFGTAKEFDVTLFDNQSNKFLDNSISQVSRNGGSVISSDFSQRFNKSFNMKKGKSFVGSPFYVSPEILLGREANFASDLWSLGIIIYEMFMGKKPFDKKNALKT